MFGALPRKLTEVSHARTRRELLEIVATLCLPGALDAETPTSRSFWVLSLLTPGQLQIAPVRGGRLYCRNEAREFIVEAGSRLHVDGQSVRTHVAGPGGEAVPFILCVPSVLERTYFGVLDLCSSDGCVVPVVRTGVEIAVGSIVAAELPVSSAAFHAQAAQAVVSRSILASMCAPQHQFADFCDTTHCQFLRSPVKPGSVTAHAVLQTGGVVLMQDGRKMSPRYSAACGGLTTAGTNRGDRYQSVPCEICRSQGLKRRGHGWGLCQEGAMGLAQRGWAWNKILATYYPEAVSARV
jgi:hypothetical protein